MKHNWEAGMCFIGDKLHCDQGVKQNGNTQLPGALFAVSYVYFQTAPFTSSTLLPGMISNWYLCSITWWFVISDWFSFFQQNNFAKKQQLCCVYPFPFASRCFARVCVCVCVCVMCVFDSLCLFLQIKRKRLLTAGEKPRVGQMDKLQNRTKNRHRADVFLGEHCSRPRSRRYSWILHFLLNIFFFFWALVVWCVYWCV